MNKVKSLTLRSADFPTSLRQIPNPPKTIYFSGASPKQWQDKPKVAVVGSRKMTRYGQLVTEFLVGELTSYGVVIISGLALGIDSAAHKSCLDKSGVTVAVLPTSLDNIYPASHRNLALRILKNDGTLLSEYKQGAETYPVNFIARNRIVSGLADILLITEAAKDSGTMHTAAFALYQGKTVMAVPGNINNPSSQGVNNLIKAGAVPVTETRDILLALKINPGAPVKKKFRGSTDESAAIAAITDGIHSQEELAAVLKFDAARLGFVLTSLEIGGHIKPDGNGRWSLV